MPAVTIIAQLMGFDDMKKCKQNNKEDVRVKIKEALRSHRFLLSCVGSMRAKNLRTRAPFYSGPHLDKPVKVKK